MYASNKCLWYYFFVVVVVFCGVFPRQVSSLKCYECTESEPSCGERFDRNNITVTDCQTSLYTLDATANQEKAYACLALRETDTATSKSIYTKRCSVKTLNDTCETIIAKNQAIAPKLRTNCIQCGSDLCNASTQSRIYFNVILIFFCFVIFKF